jgi:hypothetical protein
MSREEDLSIWERKGLPLSELRGVVSFDYNNSLVLVQASVDVVSQTFAQMRGAAILQSNVAEREVELARQCFLLFRLKGHPWTQILDKESSWNGLGEEDAERLSRVLKVKAIFYGISDTALASVYRLYDSGRLMERYDSDENGITAFDSLLRKLTLNDIKDEEEWVHTFFKDQDALEPGLRFQYLVGHVLNEPGDRISLEGLARDFEQVAYIAL